MAKHKRQPKAAAKVAADLNRNLLATLLAMLAIIAVLCVALMLELPFALTAVAAAIVAGLAIRRRVLARRTDAQPPEAKDKLSRPLAMLLVAAAVIWPFIMIEKPGSNLPLLIIGSVAAAAATWFDPIISGWLRRRPVFLWALLLILSFVIAYYLNGDTLKAKWWPIDDHEIMNWTGPSGKVKLTQIPSLLMQTEVGSPGGDRPRFRPAYYSLRIFESFLWGTNAAGWWAARLAMLALMLALLMRFFMRLLGLAPAIVLVMLLMTYSFWTDIWCRLGPGEIYCALGTAMFLEGFARVIETRFRPHVRAIASWPGWALLIAGSLLAMGSKENFLLMLLPVWVLGVMLWRRHRLGAAGLSAILVITLYGLFIAISVGLSVSHKGADIYNQSVTTGGRLGLATGGVLKFLAPFAWWDVLAAIAIIAAGFLFLLGKKLRSCRKGLLYAGLALVGMLALYVSQFIFYNGLWPQSEGGGGLFRYDFPGIFAQPLAVVAMVAVALTLMTILGMNRRLVRLAGCVIVAGVVMIITCRGYEPIRQISAIQTRNTTVWTDAWLAPVVNRLKEQPNKPVVFISGNVWDYEPVFSSRAFLRANGVTNPLYLRLLPYPVSDGLTRSLRDQLTSVSQKGGEGFEPLGALPADAEPFGVGFSTSPMNGYVWAGVLWRGQ